MKRKYNWGAVSFLAAFVLVVIFLIGFGIFHSTESEKINNDIANELRTKYQLDVKKTVSDVTFVSTKKASVELYIQVVDDNEGYSQSVNVEAEKKDGKWTITFSPIELSEIGKSDEAQEENIIIYGEEGYF